MFKKPFIQKSCKVLRKADRKGFNDRVKKSFFLEDEALEKILPKKQEITVTRIQTYQDADVTIYSVDKRPMLFDFSQYGVEGRRVIPTVYLLWQYPELAYAFTVHDGVLDYILSGANLMMPGVVKNPPRGPVTYFIDNQVACINTVTNKAIVAVGLTTMSGNSAMGGQQGKALTVLHYYSDYLCYMHDMPLLTLPKIRDEEVGDEMHALQDFEWPALGSVEAEQEPDLANDEDAMTDVTAAVKALSLDEPNASASTSKIAEATDGAATKAVPELPHIAVDAALQRCFMMAAKYSPTLQLPQLTSTFYKKEMVQMMNDQQLDIKASSYKKVSEFLKAMQKDGLCKLGQKQKGVDVVEEIDFNHELLAAFYLPVESRPKIVEEACSKESTKLNDTYMVVPEVVDIFLPKYRVGAKLTLSVAKKSIVDYVKKNGLQDIGKEHTLARTPVLQRLSPPGSTRVSNDELAQTVLHLMEGGPYKAPGVSSSPQARLARPVRMQIQTHSGKTVTVVFNLQDYPNVHLASFAREVQVIAAASAKVVKETQQVQVQGNQIDIIATLLNKKYGISKAKMIGLDLAPKMKKCKH